MQLFKVHWWTIVCIPVWPHKVVVGDPQGQVVVGTFVVIVAAFYSVGFFEGSVQSLDDLFVWAVFRGYGIIVCEPDDGSDFESM